MVTPTSRSLKLLRDEGWRTNVVEKWNVHSKKRQDLFGFIDILAMKTGKPLLAIQATSGSNSSARVKKACNLEELEMWLSTGNRFEVWSWSKRGKIGKRKLWTLRRVVITKDNLKELKESDNTE